MKERTDRTKSSHGCHCLNNEKKPKITELAIFFFFCHRIGWVICLNFLLTGFGFLCPAGAAHDGPDTISLWTREATLQEGQGMWQPRIDHVSLCPRVRKSRINSCKLFKGVLIYSRCVTCHTHLGALIQLPKYFIFAEPVASAARFGQLGWEQSHQMRWGGLSSKWIT